MDEATNSEAIYYQISFFSKEKRFENIPDSVVNVPGSSTPTNLNLLLNNSIRSLDDDWKDLSFDFLIGDLLLRTSLAEFAEDHSLTTESIVQIECLLREPAPEPESDLITSDWVADVKAFNNLLCVATYDGKLSIWTLDGKLLFTGDLDNDPMKCIDVFQHDKTNYAIVGGQNQTLVLCKLTVTKKLADATPLRIFRGHERSVECVAANKDGSRIVSGSFDNCLKLWNSENDEENSITLDNAKKAKPDFNKLPTQTPIVTLASHREAIVGVKWNPLSEVQAVTVSWDHSMIVWDLELAGPVKTLTSNKSFTSLSINPITGQILTGSVDPTVRLWDIRSQEGSMVKQSFLGHTGSFDNLVKMWDIRSPKTPLYDLTGHKDRILAVDWSMPEVIASGGVDCTIKTYRHK
uniref:NLE domain-containing protein n=1 Tax=Acrobeloides nanus TaxID=290746 RepID=A0A914CUV2_9BILA